MGAILDKAYLVVTPNAVKAGKLYAIKPSNGTGDIAVIRSTTATLINADGTFSTAAANVARLDYSKGTCPGILVENSSQNQCSYSNQFTNGYWVKAGTTAAQSGTINFLNGEKTYLLSETTANSVHTINGAVSFSTFSPFTMSCFFKKGSGANAPNIIRLVVPDNAYVNFNIATGVVLTQSAGVTGRIETYADGWFRCSLQGTNGSNPNTGLKVQFTNNVDSTTTPASLTYTGNASANVFISGAQFEGFYVASSYIPTTAAASFRAADNMVGIDYNLFTSPFGTAVVDFYVDNRDNGYLTKNILLLSFQSTIVVDITSLSLAVTSTDPDNTYTYSTGLASYGRNKFAIRWSQDAVGVSPPGIALFANGTYQGTLTDYVPFDFYNAITIGVGDLNNNINSVLTFQSTLSDAECVSLTT
jgi:hypothetical protein